MVDVGVNTFTQGRQSDASIVTLADGGYVVVWESQSQDDVNTNFGIYGQRYDAHGNPAGSEFRVNTVVAGDQTLPSVAAIGGGGFVVTWTTPGAAQGDTDIHMQRYNISGVAQGGEVLVGTTTANAQDQSSVVGLSNGGYVVAWTSAGDIHTQRYNSSGVAQGAETLVNTYTTDDQSNASVAALAGGGYIVTWQSYNQDGSDYGIYSQRYDTSGNTVGGETHVSTTTNNIQQNPTVTVLTGGGYIVSWQSYGQDGSQDGIYFQRYTSSGTAIGGEVQVNTTTSSVQSMPSIAALSGGGFIVTWQSFAQDGNAYGIFARTFDLNGNPTSTETQVNVTTIEQQTSPVVTALANGGYAIAWQSYSQDGSEYGIFKSHTAGVLPNTYTGTPGDDTFTAPDANDWTISGVGGNDTLAGAGGNDNIDGGDGNDTLRGGGGHDTIHGGIGDDLIYDTPASGLNTIDGGDGNDTLDFSENGSAFAITLALFSAAQQTVGGGSYALTGIENLTGAALNDALTGDAQANILKGGDGNDTLSGMGGADQLLGGEGNDFLYGGPGDDILDGGNGTDTATYQDVIAGVTVSLNIGGPQNTIAAGNDTLIGIENLRGSEFDDNLTGNASANTINGGGGADYIYGGGGADTLNGGEGDDRIYVDSGTNTVNGSNGSDFVQASGGTNAINGGDGDDLIFSIGTAVNTIDGGAGFDTLYVDGRGRASGMTADFTSLWTSGSGTVNGSSYTGMEALTAVVGTDFDDNINLGGAATSADVQIGDVLDIAGAGAGNDTVTGTNGFNYMSGQDGNDTMYGLGGADHLSGGNGDDTLDGGTGNDILDGGADNDILKGGAGADTMTGGTGNDTYYVDDVGDQVIENAGEGTDTVFTYFTSYTLGANLENLTATSNGDNGDVTLTGNTLNNVIIGAGYQPILGYFPNDTLNGLGGDDTLYGLSGDDMLNGGDGNDILYGGDAETWGPVTSTERDTLNGGAGDDTAYGGAGDDRLFGNDGDDRLDGGTGGDKMVGGTGNDTYVVDNAGDRANELAGEGVDTVEASISWTLGVNLENLTLTGNAAIDGTGNELDNMITGNAAANNLYGGFGADRIFSGGGADHLYGGAGDDVYVLSDGAAQIVELAGEGYDTVKVSASYSIAGMASIENLRLTGTGNFDATGNAEAQAIVGNDGNNVIDGGGGGDHMKGLAGNDTYIVRHIDDSIVEFAGNGDDTVKAALSYTLAAAPDIEHLWTIDKNATTAINLTGNAFSHDIQGNAGANVLTGGSGADTLQGFGGNDTLFGGGGADIFTFAAGTGQDSVGDFVSGTDKLDLSAFGFANFAAVQAATQNVGGSAVIDLGGGNSVTLTGVLAAQLQSGDVILGGGGGAAVAQKLVDYERISGKTAVDQYDEMRSDWHVGMWLAHDIHTPGVMAGILPIL